MDLIGEVDMVQVISLGLGVQSTALYYMSSTGEIPRADYAIFADTGKERSGTYRYLDFLLSWQQQFDGIPIVVCRDKNLYADLLDQSQNRFSSIPAFTKNPDGSVGMLKRQCTGEYKIMVVDNYIRDHIYRLPKGSRRPLTAVWHGITLDELERMAIPQQAWKVNMYPFLGYTSSKKGDTERITWGKPLTREEVIRWYVLNGIPIPPKSSCVFCPYQSDLSWANSKRNEPEDFIAAIKVDEAIRNSTQKGVENPIYLHKSCRPLKEVMFDLSVDEEWGECSGNCHV